MPTGANVTTATAGVDNTASRSGRRRRRARNEPLLTRDEKLEVRRRLLIGAALFQLLSIALIIVLYIGGQRVGDGKVLAPDTYLLTVNSHPSLRGLEIKIS